MFFRHLDDPKSGYRRVDRARLGNHSVLEESAPQEKRISKPNPKYLDDYEIGESSGVARKTQRADKSTDPAPNVATTSTRIQGGKGERSSIYELIIHLLTHGFTN